MEFLSLIVSISQLVVDIAACVGSSPTVRFYLANIAQEVERMAESLSILQEERQHVCTIHVGVLLVF